MDFIHTADWHIWNKHKYSIDNSRLQEIKQNARRTVDFAIKNKIKLIVIAGDIFHVYNPDEEMMKALTSVLRYGMDNGIYWRIITGNHDTNGISYSLESLKNILDYRDDNELLKIYPFEGYQMDVVQEDIFGINFVFIPWQPWIKDTIEWANENCLVEGGRNVMVTHCAIDGAVTSTDYEARKTKLTKSLFKNWDYVALGDFHKNQTIGGNIHYSGSIIKLNWGERNDERYFNWVKIGKEVSHKRVKIPDVGFIELKVEYKDIEKYCQNGIDPELAVMIRDSFVKLIIWGEIGLGYNISAIKALVYKYGARDVIEKVVESKYELVDDGFDEMDSTVPEDVKMSLDLEDYCMNFVNKSGVDVTKYMEYLRNKILEVK